MKGFIKVLSNIFILLIIIGLIVLGFVGITKINGGEESKQCVPEHAEMYVSVEYHAVYDIVYDRDTKVMYHLSRGVYNQGVLTLLVNPDGTPKIYGDGMR